MADETLPPINQSMLDHAARVTRRTLEGAERGDETCQRRLLQFAVADDLVTMLTRLAVFADACAPTLDELKIDARQYSADAHRLRFEVELVPNILNQAAGRAVVVELPTQVNAGAPPIAPGAESRCTGDASDNGELPRVPERAP